MRSLIPDDATGTRRWFLNEAMIAFASFRTDPPQRSDGYAAYDACFTDTQGALDSRSVDVVERAIYDFSYTMLSDYGPRTFGYEKSGEEMTKAVAAYMAFVRAAQPYGYPIPWAEAITQTGAKESCSELVNAALKNPRMPRSFAFLVAASEMLAPMDRTTAGDLWGQAGVLADKQSGDVATAYYSAQAQKLAVNKAWSDAIASQKHVVTLSGQGRSYLAYLYLKSGSLPEAEQVARELYDPAANESEVISTAEALASYHDPGPSAVGSAKNYAEELLSNYVCQLRLRTVESELEARIELAKLLLAEDKTAKAEAILQYDLPASASLQAKSLYSELGKLRASIGP